MVAGSDIPATSHPRRLCPDGGYEYARANAGIGRCLAVPL